jgi:hypothetical protein
MLVSMKLFAKMLISLKGYIGSTTNLIQRRRAHKSNCNNENAKQYNTFVYRFIRDNGSFDNWDVVLIEQVIDCKDKEHLHKRERYYIQEKKAELNKCIPLQTRKEYNDENKELVAEQRKEYNESNKDKIAQHVKKYREKNKDKINERRRIYRANKILI